MDIAAKRANTESHATDRQPSARHGDCPTNASRWFGVGLGAGREQH